MNPANFFSSSPTAANFELMSITRSQTALVEDGPCLAKASIILQTVASILPKLVMTSRLRPSLRIACRAGQNSRKSMQRMEAEFEASGEAVTGVLLEGSWYIRRRSTAVQRFTKSPGKVNEYYQLINTEALGDFFIISGIIDSFPLLKVYKENWKIFNAYQQLIVQTSICHMQFKYAMWTLLLFFFVWTVKYDQFTYMTTQNYKRLSKTNIINVPIHKLKEGLSRFFSQI